MTFAIRSVRRGDEVAFRSIRLRALTDSPGAFASTREETEAHPAEYWHDRVTSAVAGQESVLFVATDSDEWIGVAGGYVYEDGGEAVPYLISMWVDPAYRGWGIGQALVERVISWARERGFDHLVLEVEASNRQAIALYTHRGFRPTGDVRPHPTYEGLTEIMMTLSLE